MSADLKPAYKGLEERQRSGSLGNVVEVKSSFSQCVSEMDVTILLGEKGPVHIGHVFVILVYFLYK